MATFYNQASMTYNGLTTNSNRVTGVLNDALAISKTPLTQNYAPGDTVTYIITLINGRTQTFSNLTLSDNLGEYAYGGENLTPLTYVDGSVAYFINGVRTTPPTVTTTNGLEFSGISVPPNGNVTLVYEATVNPNAPLEVDSSITNTATLTGGTLAAPVEDSTTITADSAPLLTIAKSISPSTLSEDERVTYTFLIENIGNVAAGATSGVSITDVFNPVLSDLNVTLNGNVLVPTTDYTYNNGIFTTVPGVITVPEATYSRDPVTNAVVTAPGVSVLAITGTI